jgi:hypothetical protein
MNMPPVWFWFVMLTFVIVAIIAIVWIDRLMKRDMELFIESLEISNRMSKVGAFERCGKEL